MTVTARTTLIHWSPPGTRLSGSSHAEALSSRGWVRDRPARPPWVRAKPPRPAPRAVRLFEGVGAAQADFLDVEGGLYLAQDGVVDAVCVAQFDDGVAFVGDGGQAQGGVLLGPV